MADDLLTVDSMLSDLGTMDDAPEAMDGPPVEPESEEPAEEPVEPEVEPDEPEDAEEPVEEAKTEEPTDEGTKPPEEKDEFKDDADLDEGDVVKSKRRSGFYEVKESRFKNIYGNHKALQALEPILGEVPTPEAIRARQVGYLAMNRLMGDFASGDPNKQAQALGFLANTARTEMQRRANYLQQLPPAERELYGPPVDGVREFGRNVLSILSSVAPEAADEVRAAATNALIESLYPEAKRLMDAGDKNLLQALQHVEYKLTGKYRKAEEIKIPDAVDQREADLARREQALRQFSQQRVQQSEQEFVQTVGSSQRQVIEEQVAAALAPIEEHYKQFPQLFGTLQESLRNAVARGMSDPTWLQNVNADIRNTPAHERPALLERLSARFKARAEAVLRQSAPKIIKEATGVLQGRQQTVRQRAAVSAQQRAPGTGGEPPKRSLVPVPQNGDGELFSAESAMRDLDAILK